MRNLEIIKEALRVVDDELNTHPLPMPELVRVRAVITESRPELDPTLDEYRTVPEPVPEWVQGEARLLAGTAREDRSL